MKSVFITILAMLSCICAAWAGEIAGTVTFDGDAPKMKPILGMEGNPDCVRIHGGIYPSYEFLKINASNEVECVLVRVVSGLPEGGAYPVPEEPVVLSQQGCTYTPHVFVMRAGQTLRVQNPDKILHNIKALPLVNSQFNKSTSKERPEVEVVFDKIEAPFPFQCDVHGWMQAWCTVTDHPFFAVTDANGSFAIKDIPAGDYEVEFWHERLGAQTIQVSVPAEGRAAADAVFTRPKPE